MKARFFLSYARGDGSTACEYFHATLRNLGHHAYRDVTDNYGGDEWNQRIRNEIRMADAFLLFVTPEAMQSANVEREWREALRLRKRIVPLKVLTADVPAEILALHHFRDIREINEPSKIVQMADTVRQEMNDQLNALRDTLTSDIADASKRQYVEAILKDMELIFVRPEVAAFPPEVFHTFHFLAKHLATALSNGLAGAYADR
jgi:TIR domain